MSTTTILDLLRAHPFAAGLSDEQVRFLAAQAHLEDLHTGDYIFFEDEAADELQLVLSGEVLLEVAAGNLGLVGIDQLGPGDVIGKSALLPPYRYSLNAKAGAPTRLLVLAAEPLRQRCQEDPRLGYELLRRLAIVAASRLVATRKRLLEHLA